jgi:hypothetical protein
MTKVQALTNQTIQITMSPFIFLHHAVQTVGMRIVDQNGCGQSGRLRGFPHLTTQQLVTVVVKQ